MFNAGMGNQQLDSGDYGEEYVKIINQEPICACITLMGHLAT